MKKIMAMVVAALLLLVVSAFAVAESTSKNVTFEWSQTGIEYVSGWRLYWGDTSGGPFTPVVDIPYDGSEKPAYEATTLLTVNGEYGSTVVKYFVLTTLGKGEEQLESGYSNEAQASFYVAFPSPGVPVNFTIKVIVSPSE